MSVCSKLCGARGDSKGVVLLPRGVAGAIGGSLYLSQCRRCAALMAYHSGGWLATCSQSMGLLVFSACCLLLGFAALPRWSSHRQTAGYVCCSSCLALLSVLFRVECQSALRRLSLYSTLLVSAVLQSVCFTACVWRCSGCGWCSHRGHLAAVVLASPTCSATAFSHSSFLARGRASGCDSH